MKQNLLIALLFSTSLFTPLGYLLNSNFFSTSGFVLASTPIPLVFYQDEISAEINMSVYKKNGALESTPLKRKHLKNIKGPMKRASQYLAPFFLDIPPALSKSIYRRAFCKKGTLLKSFNITPEVSSIEFVSEYRSPYLSHSSFLGITCID